MLESEGSAQGQGISQAVNFQGNGINTVPH